MFFLLSCHSFIVSSLTFRPLIHFVFIFVYGVRNCSVCVYWVNLSCLTLCSPMDWSPLGSSAHGLLQARIQEWTAIFFSRGCFRPRDWTHISSISCTDRQILLPLVPPGKPRKSSNFIILHEAVQFSQNYLLKGLSFLCCSFLPPLSKIRWP